MDIKYPFKSIITRGGSIMTKIKGLRIVKKAKKLLTMRLILNHHLTSLIKRELKNILNQFYKLIIKINA